MDLKGETFIVKINSPSELIWEGTAVSVSSKNSVGPFDILPEHANFITMIQNELITVRTPNKERTFTYKYAVLSVYSGNVTIYADI